MPQAVPDAQPETQAEPQPEADPSTRFYCPDCHTAITWRRHGQDARCAPCRDQLVTRDHRRRRRAANREDTDDRAHDRRGWG